MAGSDVRRYICGLVWVLYWFVRSGDAVTIAPVPKAIRANDTDLFVTLPCNFTTKTYETPLISWYRHDDAGRMRPVMKFDLHNRLFSYDEFKGRVFRGNRGDLILTRPTVHDSGHYSCEIEVDEEQPNWAKVDVMLDVTYLSLLVQSSITASEKDPFVTLPCDFTNDSYVTSQTTWQRHTDGQTVPVMKIDVHNRPLANAGFEGRVSRGNRWDLILIKPTVSDSGEYTCEVAVNDKIEATSTVTLRVQDDTNTSDVCGQVSAPDRDVVVVVVTVVITVLVVLAVLVVVLCILRRRCHVHISIGILSGQDKGQPTSPSGNTPAEELMGSQQDDGVENISQTGIVPNGSQRQPNESTSDYQRTRMPSCSSTISEQDLIQPTSLTVNLPGEEIMGSLQRVRAEKVPLIVPNDRKRVLCQSTEPKSDNERVKLPVQTEFGDEEGAVWCPPPRKSGVDINDVHPEQKRRLIDSTDDNETFERKPSPKAGGDDTHEVQSMGRKAIPYGSKEDQELTDGRRPNSCGDEKSSRPGDEIEVGRWSVGGSVRSTANLDVTDQTLRQARQKDVGKIAARQEPSQTFQKTRELFEKPAHFNR